MISSLDTSAAHDLFLAGEIVLLPQTHAARLHRSRFIVPPGHAVQTTPPLAWHEWTASLWAELLLEGVDDRLLLNRLQEEQLWATILKNSPAPASGIQLSPSAIPDLARLARSALQRAAAHRIVPRLRSEADTVDARAFQHWLALFLARAKQERLLAPAFLEEALGTQIRAHALTLPPRIHLLGFEQLTPAQEHLLDALAAAGVLVHRMSASHPQTSHAQRQAVTLGDREQQLRFAVRLLAAKARACEAQVPRFALICADPGEYRHELERLFRELLAPELEAVTADISAVPWNFAPQASLNNVPLVADALDLLRWTVSPLPLDQIGQLLRSPFFTFSDSPELRARFDVRSTKRLPALRGTLELSEFTSLVSRSDPDAASFPELRLLEKTAQGLFRERGRRSPAAWTEEIRKLLSSIGWPGPRSLSVAEYRATEAWNGLLDLLATLHFDDASLGFRELLELLVTEAGNLPSPAARVDTPVQVLTLSESEGLTFDLAIYLDATDKNLPAPDRRHPLLPQALQRSLGIGVPATALGNAREALESLARRSETLVLLASTGDAHGDAELTPLATDLGFVPATATDLLPTEDLPLPLATESIRDPDRLPLESVEKVRGGVDVLQLQAACGFRAFATHRLGAKEARARTMGIDSLEGGSLLHEALEVVWGQLKAQAALKALSPDERREFARSSVEKAFARSRLKAPGEDRWSERYLNVLKRRYTSLLSHWLEAESDRAPFSIAALEQQQSLELGPVRLEVRIDRIDDVAGRRVLVDYKSSYDLSNKHWLDERPDAPQLPAYALGADPDTLAGIAFAQVRPGDKMGWISLTHSPGIFPRARNKTVDLPTQLESWKTELTGLAQAFADGQAHVNPKSYPHTCQYCEHRLLCRLDPSTLLEQEEEDDEIQEEDLFG